MFKIYSGTEYFYQWDLGQKLIVDSCFCKIHYCNDTGAGALVVEVYQDENGVSVADVPNILLQTTNNIRVYGVCKAGADVINTKEYDVFRVIARGKPENYVYTETDVLCYEALEERIEALEQAGGGSFRRIGFTSDCDYIATDTNGITAFAQAIAQATEGDTILVMAGEYKGEATLNIDKDLTFIAIGNVVINFSVWTQGGGDFSFETWEWLMIYEPKHTKWDGFTFSKSFSVGCYANPDNAYYNGFTTVKNCSFNAYTTIVGNCYNCDFNSNIVIGHYYGADDSTFTDCKFSCSIEANVGSDNFKRCNFHFNGNNSVNFTTWKEDNFVNCKMYAPNDILIMSDSHGNQIQLNDTVVFAQGVIDNYYNGIIGGFLVKPTAIS